MRGAFDKHPERRRKREREPVVQVPLGDPPPELNVLQVAMWRDLAEWGKEWLTVADRAQVEIAARAMCKLRDGDLKAGQLAQTALAKLGMNPVDRSRVTGGGPADSNRDPAEAYFKKQRG